MRVNTIVSERDGPGGGRTGATNRMSIRIVDLVAVR